MWPDVADVRDVLRKHGCIRPTLVAITYSFVVLTERSKEECLNEILRQIDTRPEELIGLYICPPLQTEVLCQPGYNVEYTGFYNGHHIAFRKEYGGWEYRDGERERGKKFVPKLAYSLWPENKEAILEAFWNDHAKLFDSGTTWRTRDKAHSYDGIWAEMPQNVLDEILTVKRESVKA